MVSSRFRAVLFLACIFLAALALRPRSEMPGQLEAVCEPARGLAALAAPLGWISMGETRAAERALLDGEGARRDAARAVLAAAESSAAPSEEALARGKGILHAEVVERVDGDLDRLVVRFAAGAGVERGMPVVCGDVFVGRVVAVDEAVAGLARVDLVTRRDFRVGAEVLRAEVPGDGTAGPGPDKPARLVVGGVLPRGGKSKEIVLEARCRSDGKVTSGEVRVREVERRGEDAYRTLADGFLLGRLEPVGDRGQVLGVRPAFDFDSGPSHVGILCPSEHAPAGLDLARDPFGEAHWIPARVGLAGNVSYWRETRILTRGKRHSVEDGAAVVLGGSLLGCIERADRATSRVALLGDPGFEITAIASPATGRGAAATVPIGKLVSLGRRRSDGTVAMRWDPAVRADTGAAEVVLYTASGKRSVPPGLRIGTTRLPTGLPAGTRGPFVLDVRQDETGLSISEVRVWRDVLPAADDSAEKRP